MGLSGCLKGEVPYAINLDQEKEALELAATYRDILGKDNYFLEMQDHGIAQQVKINRVLPRLAKELGVGLVASNDVHFLDRSSHKSHDVLVCIGTGSNVDDERRMRYQEELYFKSPAEIAAMAKAISGAMALPAATARPSRARALKVTGCTSAQGSTFRS